MEKEGFIIVRETIHLTRSSQQLNAVSHQTININILQYDRNRTVGKDDNLVMEQVY